MKTLKIFGIFLLSLSLINLSACASKPNQEGTGEYLDDSVITTKVKAAILGEKSLKVAETAQLPAMFKVAFGLLTLGPDAVKPFGPIQLQVNKGFGFEYLSILELSDVNSRFLTIIVFKINNYLSLLSIKY